MGKEIVASHVEACSLGESRWSELVVGRTGKLLAIGIGIQVLQQLVGMNAFMYFGPRIFSGLGLNGNNAQIVCNSVNSAATLPAIMLADRCGRCRLLVWSASGMFAACAA